MTKPKLVPIVEPRFFAFNVQHLIVTSTLVSFIRSSDNAFAEVALIEGSKLDLKVYDTDNPFTKLVDYVRIIRLDTDNNKRLWLMQSLLTLLREVHHDASHTITEALLDPDASLDYLMGIQRVIEEVYNEE